MPLRWADGQSRDKGTKGADDVVRRARRFGKPRLGAVLPNEPRVRRTRIFATQADQIRRMGSRTTVKDSQSFAAEESPLGSRRRGSSR